MTLSAQEAFVVYFKVSILCGIVLASPFIFYQFWAFVGAGLYPHEKRYVYSVLPASVTLFLAGVTLCQLVVHPSAVRGEAGHAVTVRGVRPGRTGVSAPSASAGTGPPGRRPSRGTR